MKRRDALLSGVSLSTHFLLARKTNFNQSMIHALEALGRSTGVDRVYIFENHYDSSKGENITSQIFEWTRDAKLKEINNPLLKNISYEKYLIRWYHTLSQGRPVHGDVKDFPWTERSFLEPQKIQSILVLPIIIEDRFWGFIGFDDCAQTREWSESEISILAAAAGSLGSAVVRKRAENSLKESESRFRDVVNAVGEYIWETDARGHFVFLTDKIQEILGYTPSQCLGKTFFDFMSPPEAARIKKIYLKARDNQKPLYNLEIKTIHKNQETVWQRISAIPVLNGNNEVIGYRGAALDITQQFRNLEEIKKAKNAAEKNAEDKSRFLSHMSHEIRTPMNVIKGLSDLLLEETLTESMRENVEAIGFSANNLLAVINDILDFSKIESGKITFESISFDLREFIHKNIQAFRVKAREKNLVMESRIDEKIPQFLKGDPYKLNQILTNLLGNAIKFTHEGKIALEAELSHQEPWKAVINFRVSDTGIGIPKKRLKTVFESFSQAGPDTTRKYGGTGLGLTICKNLIEKQGGSIKVRSIPGKGTVFEFHLPFTLEKQVKKTAPEKKEKQSLKGVKLLIAEDNPMNQFLLKRVLEKWDTDFEIVENGLKVLEKLQTTKYDLILMDIQMPEMDGLEATEVIRNSSSLKDIPIIAFTANAMDRYFTKNENRLFDEVVLKPVNQQELYEKIKTLFPDFSLKKAPESPTEKVDLSYIEEFVREEPPEKMKELLELFITNLDRNRTFIEESMHRKDWKSLARAAHTLKNDFLNVRLKQSAEKFEQMEQIALYEKDMGLLKEIIDEILFLINKVHTEVDLILSDFNADN
jgi:PAS domain S-box-containing protein